MPPDQTNEGCIMIARTDYDFLALDDVEFTDAVQVELARLCHETGVTNPDPFLIVTWARHHPGALHAMFFWDDSQTDSERAADFDWYQTECAKVERAAVPWLH